MPRSRTEITTNLSLQARLKNGFGVSLPDVPEALRGRELTMTVPVVFKLEAL
jgi:hypothetical protein